MDFLGSLPRDPNLAARKLGPAICIYNKLGREMLARSQVARMSYDLTYVRCLYQALVYVFKIQLGLKILKKRKQQ
jgi:hypothetical protein